MSTKKRILVIGSGPCGLTSLKACKDENLDVVCYERTGDYGGLWRYHDNDLDGLPSVMKSTVSNTSKEMSSFSDFPPPTHFPIYMHHTAVLKYLELYAEHFDLLTHINYFQEVVEMIPSEDYGTTGKWLVKVRDLHRDEVREEIFDGVMVCVGHHAYPSVPTYSGMDLFSGQVIHSHSYKTFNDFYGKRVLVVGLGNSGADIAVDLSNIASQVLLSTRRGAWIYPRTLAKGKPFDVMLNRRYKTLQPSSYVTWKLENSLNLSMDHKRYGVRPYHRISSQHPTINDDLKSRLVCGSVLLKRDVKEFTENGAKFDGEEEPTALDVVIFATGYHIKFPFLNDDLLRVGKNNKVFLYKNVFPPQLKRPSLAIIGLIQPSGSLFPVFEIQARWFASLITGKTQLPSSETMLADVRQIEDFRARNYVQSQRHSVEANWLGYMDDIANQIGVKPNMAALLLKDPKLFWTCLMGPCLPYQYRLKGPHKWEGAKDAILSYKDRMYEHLNTREK